MSFVETFPILDRDALGEVCKLAAHASLVDGRLTAGGGASLVKNSLVGTANDQASAQVSELLVRAVMASQEVAAFVFPRRIRSPVLTLYKEGMYYGSHMDAPIASMQTGDPEASEFRTDLAMTIFLSPPEAYGGGDLVIELGGGKTIRFKEAAGYAAVYPAAFYHHVEPITHGERLVAISWIQSTVRSHQRRRILADLARAQRFLAHGRRQEVGASIQSASHQLTQLWHDT